MTTRGKETPVRLGVLVVRAPALITDGAVVAFAAWTVLYHAALFLDVAPSVTFRVWLVACLVAAGVAVVRWRRGAAYRGATPATATGAVPAGATAASRGPGAGTGPDAGTAGTGPDAGTAGTGPDAGTAGSGPDAGSGAATARRRLITVGVAAGLTAALLAGLRQPWLPWLPWWLVVAVAAVAAVAAALAVRTAAAGTDRPVRPPAGVAESAYALVLAAAAGVSSLFFARNTPDDVYYVGKSVWVAERDFVPLRDFLFTQNTGHASTAEPPIPSIEVFVGALARTLGMHAPSALWYLVLPVVAGVSVLALWRLIRRWSPRRPALALTVAIGYLYLVVGDDAALGTYWLPRLHEGKGMFVSIAVPLAWLYLTDWFDTRSRRALGLVVAVSVAASGLSTTAAIILPVLAAAAGLGMLLVRRWRDGLVGAVALVAYPMAAVVVTRIALGPLDEVATMRRVYGAPVTYQRTLLFGVLGVLGGIALWCGPYLVRRGTPALMATGVAVTTTVVLVPGVMEALNGATGLAVVLWRLPWIIPLAALIGIISTVDPPSRWWPAGARVARWLAPATVAAALVATFAVAGTPLWSQSSYVEVHDRPTWKLPQQRQRLAFWMQGLDRQGGLLLAPSVLMRTMPIVTSRVPVVNARTYYLLDYGWDSQFSTDRRNLSYFADGLPTVPLTEIKAGMARLDVAVMCVYRGNHTAIEAAPYLGMDEFATHGRPGAMVCFRKPADTGG